MGTLPQAKEQLLERLTRNILRESRYYEDEYFEVYDKVIAMTTEEATDTLKKLERQRLDSITRWDKIMKDYSEVYQRWEQSLLP